MRIFKSLLLLSICASLTFAQLSADDVTTFTLDNGMKFLVLQDNTIPNISFYIYWKVGSRNEVPGITGLSHFFEHMMFNGAKKYGPGEFDRIMEAGGGSNNAFTTENITAYTNWVPSDFLEMMFALEADRIGALAIADDIVESERGVVASERITSLENSNYTFLSEQVTLAAMAAHPYRWSVIGYESDIKNWSKQDLLDYHRIFYAPNNGVCVVVGAVDPAEVERLAKEYIGPIPAQNPPREVHTVEPEQLGEKRIDVHKEVSTPNLMISYHVPETKHPDFFALSLLDSILSEGRTSRLNKRLIDEKSLAVYVTTSFSRSFDPYLFTFYAVAAGGADVGELESEIYVILDDIKENGVTERDLQKAKNQFKTDFYRSLTTQSGKAGVLGSHEVFYGDFRKLFTIVDDYDKVSVDDIKRVAKQYFSRRNRTVGILRDLDNEEGY